MVYERDVSEKLGHEYPVHDSKEDTDLNYDCGVRHVLEEISHGEHTASVGGVLFGTHNRYSVEKAVTLMQELRIPPNTGTVGIGQLQGMADYLSFSVVNSGHSVHKFMAYGAESDVIPFLVRRAQENDNTSENAQLERQFYAEELRKRHSL